jgi:hypothetical protein
VIDKKEELRFPEALWPIQKVIFQFVNLLKWNEPRSFENSPFWFSPLLPPPWITFTVADQDCRWQMSSSASQRVKTGRHIYKAIHDSCEAPMTRI